MYACGFEVGTPFTSRTGFDVLGRDGIRLSEYWAQGMRSLHGIHAHGFPNLFIVQPTQGANLISNVLHNLVEAGRTIAMVVARAGATGARQVEVSQDAEATWLELLQQGGQRMIASLECTPGYYNNEGQAPAPHARYNLGYPAGATAYFRYLDEWRNTGAFAGLEFS